MTIRTKKKMMFFLRVCHPKRRASIGENMSFMYNTYHLNVLMFFYWILVTGGSILKQ